jgi:hypothetical protein
MPMYLVETVTIFRQRYVVEAKEAEHACDVVTMAEVSGEDIKEFSQKFIDENITSCRMIDETEYFRLFDEDNDYLSTWPEYKKLESINVVNYDS